MNVLRSILINAVVNLPEKNLHKMFITVSNLCGGLTDADTLSPKQAMIYDASKLLIQLPYEDIDFICGFISKYARNKGIKKAAPDATNIQSGKVDSV